MAAAISGGSFPAARQQYGRWNRQAEKSKRDLYQTMTEGTAGCDRYKHKLKWGDRGAPVLLQRDSPMKA